MNSTTMIIEKDTECLTWKDVVMLLAKKMGVDAFELTGFSIRVNFETKSLTVYRRVDEVELNFFLGDEIKMCSFQPAELTLNMALAMPISHVPCEGLLLDKDGDVFDIALIGSSMSSLRFPLNTLPKIKVEIH